MKRHEIITRTQRHALEGRHDRAIAEYSRLAQADPDDVRIWLKITSLEPSTPWHWVALADAYVASGQQRRAVCCYEKAAKLYRLAVERAGPGCAQLGPLISLLERLVVLKEDSREVVQELARLVDRTDEPRPPGAKEAAGGEALGGEEQRDDEVTGVYNRAPLAAREGQHRPLPSVHDVSPSGPPRGPEGDAMPWATQILQTPDPVPLDPPEVDALALDPTAFADELPGAEDLELAFERITLTDPPSSTAAEAGRLRSGLQKVDRFLELNRHQDARTILNDLALLSPDDPLVVDRMAEIYARELSLRVRTPT